MIEYICGLIGVVGVIVVYAGGGLIAGYPNMVIMGIGIGIGAWIFLELFIV